MVDSEKQLVVLILDEVDQTTKKLSNDFLYNLTRLNSEISQSQISIVGISNNLTFLDELDPRVRSSLSEEEIIFPHIMPYNYKRFCVREQKKCLKKELFVMRELLLNVLLLLQESTGMLGER